MQIKTDQALRTEAAIERLHLEAPDLRQYVKLVGCYLWAEFPNKPDAGIRGRLKALGFHWAPKRKVWMNRCGHARTGQAKSYHPKDKYGSLRLPDEA